MIVSPGRSAKRAVLNWAAKYFIALRQKGEAGLQELHSYGIEYIVTVEEFFEDVDSEDCGDLVQAEGYLNEGQEENSESNET